MKIQKTQPIDELYLAWLEEIAKEFEWDQNETLKHIIWREFHQIEERRKYLEEYYGKTNKRNTKRRRSSKNRNDQEIL